MSTGSSNPTPDVVLPTLGLLKRLRAIPVYPFLIAMYPVVSLAATNIAEIRLTDAYRAFALSLLTAFMLLIIISIVLRSVRKAAMLSSIYLIGIFSYGHLYTLLKPIAIGDFLVGRHRYLAPAFLVGVATLTWIVLRVKSMPSTAHSILTVAIVLALAPPLLVIGSTLKESPTYQEQFADLSLGETREFEPPDTRILPDIYYIVVDAYARSDHLRELFGYDNSEFDAFLQARGFYLADQANTNYTSTALSLASSLNLDYFRTLGIDLSLGHYPLNMREPIVHSRVRRILEGYGYITVAFPSGYNPTELYDADYFLIPDMSKFDELRQEGSVNAFEELFLETTAARLLIDLDGLLNTPLDSFISARLSAPENLQRAIVLSSFDRLGEVADIAGPKFVFAHITSPHSPYFFGPKGENTGEVKLFTFGDTSPEDDWKQDVPKYLDQLTYVNSRLREVINSILAASESPPIILLQSDHGPDLGLDWDNPEESALLTRVGILSAYYLPERCRGDLYPTITPVNSFRIVLNCVAGTSYDLLPDISYYNPHVRSEPWDIYPYEEYLD